MNTKYLFTALLFVGFQLVNGQDKMECNDTTQNHIEHLKSFYFEYLYRPDVPDHKNRIKILRKYCSLKLIDKITEMWKNMELDYDPFTFAQDNLPVSTLDYLKVDKYGKQKNVYEVSFPNSNEVDKEGTHIRLEVEDTEDGYKVSDIISVYDTEVGLDFPLGR